MKKTVVILSALVLLSLWGCGKKTPEETIPPETVPETTVSGEPELEYGKAQINGIPAVLEVLSRGDSVDIVESFDEYHYIVKRDVGYGLVEKNLVRPETEPAYETWTGYAYQDAEIFDNYRLAGKSVKKLSANTQVEVLEDLGWCVLISCDHDTGYMKPESLSKTQRSGESHSGTEGSGEDGGDIWMRYSGNLVLLSSVAPQEGTVSGRATVLADETQVILGYFDRGDEIPLVKQSVGMEILTVYLDGIYAQVSGAYVQTAGEAAYTTWEGRSQQIISVYEDLWMRKSPVERLNANTAVTVLQDLEHCYLVEVNGILGYVKKEAVAPLTEEIPEETVPDVTKATEPKPTEPKATEPKPTEPKPTESKPTEPKPTEPKPTEPEPTEPEPTEPKPTEPKPTEPEPTEPKPTEPKPTEPKPTEPEPTEPEPTEATKPKLDPEWTPPIL